MVQGRVMGVLEPSRVIGVRHRSKMFERVRRSSDNYASNVTARHTDFLPVVFYVLPTSPGTFHNFPGKLLLIRILQEYHAQQSHRLLDVSM